MPVYDSPSANWQAGGYSFWDSDSNVESFTDLIGRIGNNISGRTALNQYNSAEAEKNRQFQLMMSNTAYSRAAQDMKNAGINPASLGGNATMSPASTPSGSAAQASNIRSGGGLMRGVLTVFLNAISNGIAGSLYSAASSSKSLSDDGLKKITDIAKNAAESISSASEAKKPKDVWSKDPKDVTDDDLDQMFKDLGLVDKDYKYPGDKTVSFDDRDIEFMKRYNKNYNWSHHRAGPNSDG